MTATEEELAYCAIHKMYFDDYCDPCVFPPEDDRLDDGYNLDDPFDEYIPFEVLG